MRSWNAIEAAQHNERHGKLPAQLQRPVRLTIPSFFHGRDPRTDHERPRHRAGAASFSRLLVATRHGVCMRRPLAIPEYLTAPSPLASLVASSPRRPSFAPPLSPNTYWTSRADISPQETLRRVPTSSRPVAPSATPSRRTVATRSVPLCTASSAARPVPSRVTPTPTPTSRRASPGTTTPCSPTSRTPRSTSLVLRWPSVVSRRRRTGTT